MPRKTKEQKERKAREAAAAVPLPPPGEFFVKASEVPEPPADCSNEVYAVYAIAPTASRTLKQQNCKHAKRKWFLILFDEKMRCCCHEECFGGPKEASSQMHQCRDCGIQCCGGCMGAFKRANRSVSKEYSAGTSDDESEMATW